MLRSICKAARGLLVAPYPASFIKPYTNTSNKTRSIFTASTRPQAPLRAIKSYPVFPQGQLKYEQSSILQVLGSRYVVNTTRDLKAEERARNDKLKADPEHVSTTSTTTPIFGVKTPAHEGDDVDMLKGIKSDLKTIKDTFALSDVPREVFYIGLAGLMPYVATSFSTLGLAWDINHSNVYGTGYLITGETAQHLLHILEPMQVGYGAVILSFLGAIHWGLEFAEYGGRKHYSRYAIGLIAPAYAWSTTLLPLHSALLSQFIGFTALYFYDTTATTKGYAPPWYSTYRFVLTFVVGACIVTTLVGRGQIGDFTSHVRRPADRLQAIRDSQRMAMDHERQEIMRGRQLEKSRRSQDGESSGQATPTSEEDEEAEQTSTNEPQKLNSSSASDERHGTSEQKSQEELRAEMKTALKPTLNVNGIGANSMEER